MKKFYLEGIIGMDLNLAKKSAGFSGYCLKIKQENSNNIKYKSNTILVELENNKIIKASLISVM